MDLTKFFEEDTQNIAELLDEKTLQEIYLKVSQKLEDDKSAMGDKIDKLRSNVKLASLISERNKPFLGASDVVFPLVSNACIQYGSTAYQALFPDDDIVRFKVIGSDNGEPAVNDRGEPILDENGQPKMEFVGNKNKIGTRIATTMNYQFTEEMTYWKPEAIKALYRLPALGTIFKKAVWDFITDKPSSRTIFPDKIIINPNCVEIDRNIWSEILDLDKQTIASNINAGLFVDYDYSKVDNTIKTQTDTIKDDSKSNTNNTVTVEFIEQHTYLDLDEDGIEEPYCVIFDTGSQIITRITPDYDLDGIKKKDGKIYYIERNECLIEYGFLPDLAGGLYSVGYAELLSNNNLAINAIINQMIDCGNLKSKGGGFINTGLDLMSGSLTFKMGEYKKVNIANGNLAANVFPLPFPDASPVMFSLLGVLIESGKEVGSLRDVLTGETAANMAPTTYMGLVEQGMKQSIAILKNNHESFKREFKIIRKLNAKYLSREKYAEILDVKDPNKVSPMMDFSAKKCDVVLISDSNSITSAQKFAQAQLLMSLKDDPYYNPIEVRKMFNEAIQMSKLNEIVAPPSPSPDAGLILAQAEDKKANAKQIEAEVKAQQTLAQINEAAEKMQLMYSEIKVNESTVLKNISEAFNKEKEIQIKELVEYEKAMTARINTAIQARALEHDKIAQENSNQQQSE